MEGSDCSTPNSPHLPDPTVQSIPRILLPSINLEPTSGYTHTPCCRVRHDSCTGNALQLADNDTLLAIGERSAAGLGGGVHAIEIVHGFIDDDSQRDQVRGDTALEVLACETDAACFDEEVECLAVACAFVVFLGMCIGSLDGDCGVQYASCEVRVGA